MPPLIPEVHAWLTRLADSLAHLPGFDSLWLGGSAASGEWVAGVSDVDVIVLWGDQLPELESLREAVRPILIDAPAPADVLIVTRKVAENPSMSPHYEMYGGVHLIDAPEPVFAGPEDDPTVLFDLESARISHVLVRGDSTWPSTDPVPTRLLLAAADRHLAEWEGYASFRQPHMAALQAARAWMLASEGITASKVSAGRWALARWPKPDLLDAAIRRQQGDLNAEVSEADARELIAHARSVIQATLEQP